MNPCTLEASALFDLAGKKALITGASGFLGRTMAQTLLANGATVIALGASKRFEAFCEEMGKAPELADRFVPYRVNLEDTGVLISTLQHIVAVEGYVEIAINNAHSLGAKTGFNQVDGMLEKATVAQIEANLAGGVIWPILIAQALGQQMRERSCGSIINIASMYGAVAPNPPLYEDTPFLNPPGYSVAKAGMLALTRYIASFWGPYGIRCNAILPGAFPNVETKTENSVDQGDFFLDRLTQRACLRRVGRPADLAGALLFLASDASTFVTGQALHVDGGWTIT